MTPLHFKFRLIRTASGYTQQNVADELGKPQQTYQEIESGKTKITYEMIEDFAKIFNMSAVEVLQYGENQVQHNHQQAGGNAAIIIIQQMPAEMITIFTELTNAINSLNPK